MSSQTIKQEIQAKGVTMLPHQERVVVERAELHEKLTKLLAFMNTESFEALPDRDRYLLNKQASFMGFYRDTLDERIELFQDDNDFPLGKACDLSGDGTCEACQ